MYNFASSDTLFSSNHAGFGWFGFNGKEKDDEVSVAGGDYDYGARIYDSRVGRWLSVDPKLKAFESPFVSFANNPLLFKDPDGKDNVVYLVVLPSALEKMSATQIAGMIDEANKNFKDLGLDTRVEYFDNATSGNEPFKFDYMDNNDAVAILGSVEEIQKYVTENELSSNADFKVGSGDWPGAEKSEGGFKDGIGSFTGNIIGIDADYLDETAKECNTTVPEIGGFLINHGAGHNSGEGDRSDLGVMTNGTWTVDNIAHGGSLKDNLDVNKKSNKDYTGSVKKRFQFGQDKREANANYKYERIMSKVNKKN